MYMVRTFIFVKIVNQSKFYQTKYLYITSSICLDDPNYNLFKTQISIELFFFNVERNLNSLGTFSLRSKLKLDVIYGNNVEIM